MSPVRTVLVIFLITFNICYADMQEVYSVSDLSVLDHFHHFSFLCEFYQKVSTDNRLMFYYLPVDCCCISEHGAW